MFIVIGVQEGHMDGQPLTAWSTKKLAETEIALCIESDAGFDSYDVINIIHGLDESMWAAE